MQQHNTMEIDVEDISLFVERASGMIYEAKFFDDYALMRPATPELYKYIRNVELSKVLDDFEEFSGDRETVLRHIATGEPTDILQEKRR